MCSQINASELPLEGDAEEARQVLERSPIELPKYRLDRVHVSILNVDYAPPHGTGYARPLSESRLQRLRKDWDPLACGPIVVNRRSGNELFVIDGNHRRVVAFEKGMLTVPAMLFSGLERPKEADLYTKLGTVFGQTPATRFQSKLVAGDPDAMAIARVVERYGLAMLASGQAGHDTIKAVARVEYIYTRGGAQGLTWVLGLLTTAWPNDPRSLTEMCLEGAFGFWQRYGGLVELEDLAQVLQAAGLAAVEERADTTWAKLDLGPRSNTYGHAMAEIWMAARKKRLPPWERISGPSDTSLHYNERGVFSMPRYQGSNSYRLAANPAPQHLSSPPEPRAEPDA